jgi:hypothetical protein
LISCSVFYAVLNAFILSFSRSQSSYFHSESSVLVNSTYQSVSCQIT